MKALIVADSENVIANVSEVLKLAGYDVIVYRWLLKAIDNIEEIAPHLIVVSTQDYPRHWKTLAQFSETQFGDYTPQVVLYTGGELSDEDAKKAQALHVRGSFDSVGVDGLDQLRKILTSVDDIYSGNFGNQPESILPLEIREKASTEIQDTTQELDGDEEEEVPTVDGIFAERGVDQESLEENQEVPVMEEESTGVEESIPDWVESPVAEDESVEDEVVEEPVLNSDSVWESTLEEESDDESEESFWESEDEDSDSEEESAVEESAVEETEPVTTEHLPSTLEDDDFDEHFFDEDDVPSPSDDAIEEEVDSFIDSEILGEDTVTDSTDDIEESNEDHAPAPSVDDILKQNVSYDENDIKWKFADEEAYTGQEDMSDYDDIDMSDISVPIHADTESSFKEAEIFGMDESLPRQEEMEPEMEEAAPGQEETEPVMDEAVPSQEETEPVMEEAVPSQEETEPVMEEATPSQEEMEPVMEDAAPPSPSETRQVKACTLMLTDPTTGKVVFGRARDFDGEKVSFTPDSLLSLPEGTEIPFTTIKTSDSLESYSAKVLSSGDVLLLSLSKSA